MKLLQHDRVPACCQPCWSALVLLASTSTMAPAVWQFATLQPEAEEAFLTPA